MPTDWYDARVPEKPLRGITTDRDGIRHRVTASEWDHKGNRLVTTTCGLRVVLLRGRGKQRATSRCGTCYG